jgi:cytochrome c oxidase assembly protein subunit 15
MYNKALHWYSVVTAFCTFLLLIAGGLVTSTGSGLAVPDWPLSYGQLMPPMIGGIFYEHGHRMVATLVGLMTIILAVWIWRNDSRKWLRWLAVVALVVVIVQGALGGLTVLLMLPTAISVSHATLAQTFFSIVSCIALFTSKWWLQYEIKKPQVRIPKKLVSLCILVTSAIYLQLIFGAIMRHTGSGLAVPDFPLAYGQLLPSISPEALEAYNRFLIYEDFRLAADGAITVNQILIHMLHRFWAIVVAIAVVALGVNVRNLSVPVLRTYSRLILLLLLVQIGLGAWTVLSRKAFEIATAHVAVGALLLVLSVLLIFMTLRVSGRFDTVLQEGSTPQEAYA